MRHANTLVSNRPLFRPSFLRLLGPGGSDDTLLDGTWEVGESVSATEMPAQFAHKAPVPGLANLAQPAFKDVDKFCSRENIANRIRGGVYPSPG